MADFRSATAVRQAMNDAGLALIDAGAGPGTIKIYAGAVPASVNDALAGQTLLAVLTLSDPAFAATDANGVATAGPIVADASAEADGDATFFRIEDSNSVVRYQGDVSDNAGAGDLKINATNAHITAGVQVDITALTVTLPEVA